MLALQQDLSTSNMYQLPVQPYNKSFLNLIILLTMIVGVETQLDKYDDKIPSLQLRQM